MNALIAGRQDLASVLAGAAPPIGDDTARALHNRNQRCHVPTIECGLNDHIDESECQSGKEIAVTAEARHPNFIFDAGQGGTFVWSASSLRFALEVQDVQRRREELGAVVGADAYSPATMHPRNPGLLHYGVHGVEMLYALMGAGCQTVRAGEGAFGPAVEQILSLARA